MKEAKDETLALLALLPIKPEELVSTILESWNSFLNTKIGEEELRIPQDIELAPQIIGTFLEKIIAHRLSNRFQGVWRAGIGNEKDIHCIQDDKYSMEMKTSTSSDAIFGNRSYAQVVVGSEKKDKKGYFIAINYDAPKGEYLGKIRRISIGWLEHTDWKGQKAASGQQASLTKEAKANKMIVIYVRPSEEVKLEINVHNKQETLLTEIEGMEKIVKGVRKATLDLEAKVKEAETNISKINELKLEK